MTIRTTPWDSAEHLNTDEEIQAYLEACLEEAGDDPALLLQGLGVIARAKNMSQLARDTGLTREGLFKALSPESNPTFSTVVKVVKALGLRITVQTQHEPTSAAPTPPNQEEHPMDIKPLRTDADYRAALKEVEGLMNAEPDTPDSDQLNVMVTLIEAYEA